MNYLKSKKLNTALNDSSESSTKNPAKDVSYIYDDEFDDDCIAIPYAPPPGNSTAVGVREENPIVYFEIHSSGGRTLRDGTITTPKNLGKLYFELRSDLLPISSLNFVYLVSGKRGYGSDGVCYHYKGIRIHKIFRNKFFQSGDLLDERGLCSRSSFNNGSLFRDENYILRHTGPGCLSYCSRGPDTNGSLFQVTFTQNTDLDNRNVVFGCLASAESYECLERINNFGTPHGDPLEEIRIVDCGLEYPNLAALGL